MEKFNKIYKESRILVSDDLIDASDADIDDAINEETVGMVIYTADMSKIKRKGLAGKWVSVVSRGTGGGGGGDVDEFDPITNDDMLRNISCKSRVK